MSDEGAVAVVGYGPAGLTVARLLAERGLSVIVLCPDSSDEAELNASHSASSYVGASRRGQGVGGSARYWAGQCMRFLPEDFQAREWLPLSGWPWTYESFAKYYCQAETLFGLSPDVESKPTVSFPSVGPSSTGDMIRCSSRFLKERDIANAYYKASKRAMGGIRLLVGSVALSIKVDGSGRVVGLRYLRDGRIQWLSCHRVVLAAGALENARLCLMSSLGGKWVGRCLADHPGGEVGSIELGQSQVGRFVSAFAINYRGEKTLPKFALPMELQRQHESQAEVVIPSLIAMDLPCTAP